MTTNENTPLLLNGHANGDASGEGASPNGKRSPSLWERVATAELRLLVAGFIITTAFCFTQVPILYAFLKMECEEFYTIHPPYEGTGDRCKRPEIESGAAVQMMFVGLSAIVCGVLNLIVVGLQIRRWGPRMAMLINTLFPILRVYLQSVAVGIGFKAGMILMQLSQIVSIIGGPAGYMLVLNTAIAEVVEPAKRTGSFGKLQGGSFFGTAVGFLLGGVVGEMTSIRTPFDIAAGLLTFCFIYCLFLMPYIDPNSLGGADKDPSSPRKKPQSLVSVLGPRKLRLKDGRIITYWGLPLLTLGVFIAGLAVGYAATLTQMFSLTVLNFSPSANSGFMFLNGAVRGLFLIFVFPRIIAWGRRRLAPVKDSPKPQPAKTATIPTEPLDMPPIADGVVEQEPVNPPEPVDQSAGAAFDLIFLRWSMCGDAFTTGCIGFATKPWHIYLAGTLLPLFSGSDPAGKGVLTDIVTASERPHALQAMTLVQQVAALSTVGLFGSVYAAFSKMGAEHLTFFCNAAVALVSILIFCLCRLPPPGSTVVDDEEEEEEEEDVACYDRESTTSSSSDSD